LLKPFSDFFKWWMYVARDSDYQLFESEEPFFVRQLIPVAIPAAMDEEVE